MKRLLVISLLISIIPAASAQTGKWISLFDGNTLNGWKKAVGTADYKVENGAIVGLTGSSSLNSFLVSNNEYADYTL